MKFLMKLVLVTLITLALTNEPPKKNLAAPVNKQEVQAAKAHKPVEPQQTVQPQPVQAAHQEQPKPQPVTGCEHYRQLIQKYFNATSTPLKIAYAESGCNPQAVGDTHLTYWKGGIHYGMSCGLFQIRHLPGRPSCEALKDPETNVAYAKRLHQANGWKPWSVCVKKVSCL